MFNELLKLNRSNRSKTPLEDFTTELFVGILNYDFLLRERFFEKFLGSDSENLRIQTQRKFRLAGNRDCIIDIVIEGSDEIYFIENKVNAGEGVEQLIRYAHALDVYKEEGYKTKLLYCTKIFDEKSIKSHDFFQYSWHFLSRFIKENYSEKLSLDFVKYLKNNNMSTDMTILSSDLVTMENASKVLGLMNRNIENVLGEFSRCFPNAADLRKGNKLKEQMFHHNRICVMASPIVEGKEWSEILYGFDLTGSLVVQIFISSINEEFQKFDKIFRHDENFLYQEYENLGSRIYLEQNLGVYLNNENSEDEIKKWFIQSFKKMLEAIEKTKNEIRWINYNSNSELNIL